MKREKKKVSANGKQKNGASGDGNPEWEDVAERFSSLSSDFGSLVEMMKKDDKPEE